MDGELGEANDGYRPVIEAGLTDPMQFHCLARPLKKSWPRLFETHDTFCGQLKPYICERMAFSGLKQDTYVTIVRKMYIKYCSDKPELEEKAKSRARRSDNWRLCDMRFNILEAARSRTGRRAIQVLLLNGTHSIPGMIEELSNLIDYVDIQTTETIDTEHMSIHNDSDLFESRPMMQNVRGKIVRRRRHWTREEDGKLFAMKADECKWSEISLELNQRTCTGCNDRYRNILKAEERRKILNTMPLERVDRQQDTSGRQKERGKQDATSTLKRMISEDEPKKRRKWTAQENEILMRMKTDNASWVAISACIEGRTNVDCKDRYRNMIK